MKNKRNNLSKITVTSVVVLSSIFICHSDKAKATNKKPKVTTTPTQSTTTITTTPSTLTTTTTTTSTLTPIPSTSGAGGLNPNVKPKKPSFFSSLLGKKPKPEEPIYSPDLYQNVDKSGNPVLSPTDGLMASASAPGSDTLDTYNIGKLNIMQPDQRGDLTTHSQPTAPGWRPPSNVSEEDIYEEINLPPGVTHTPANQGNLSGRPLPEPPSNQGVKTLTPANASGGDDKKDPANKPHDRDNKSNTDQSNNSNTQDSPPKNSDNSSTQNTDSGGQEPPDDNRPPSSKNTSNAEVQTEDSTEDKSVQTENSTENKSVQTVPNSTGTESQTDYKDLEKNLILGLVRTNIDEVIQSNKDRAEILRDLPHGRLHSAGARGYFYTALIHKSTLFNLSDLRFTGETQTIPLNPLRGTPLDTIENTQKLANVMTSESAFKNQAAGLEMSFYKNLSNLTDLSANLSGLSREDIKSNQKFAAAASELQSYQIDILDGLKNYNKVKEMALSVLNNKFQKPEAKTKLLLEAYVKVADNAITILDTKSKLVNKLIGEFDPKQ